MSGKVGDYRTWHVPLCPGHAEIAASSGGPPAPVRQGRTTNVARHPTRSQVGLRQQLYGTYASTLVRFTSAGHHARPGIAWVVARTVKRGRPGLSRLVAESALAFGLLSYLGAVLISKTTLFSGVFARGSSCRGCASPHSRSSRLSCRDWPVTLGQGRSGG